MKPLLVLALLLGATPAGAHVGEGLDNHFATGFGHPFGGLDHCLAMIAVGMVAAFQGGRARWLLPTCFLGAMLGGFVIGATQFFALPAYEAMIAASVIGLGLVLVVARPLPLVLGGMLTAFFGFAHGFAHGIEGTLTFAYAAGFLLATAILHGFGLAIGIGVAKLQQPKLYRVVGGAIAAVGLVLAVG